MENALTEFMKDVSDSLGLITVEKDSPIVYMVKDPDEEDGYTSEPLLSSKSLPFVQPYLSNTRKLIEVRDGKPTLTRLPFNPLIEDSIKAETESFRALKNRIGYKLRLSVYELGYLLISYLQDDCKEIKEHKIHKTAILGEFLENSIRANTKNVKKIVDTDTFKAWQKVCIGSGSKKVENRKALLEVNSVRSKTVNNEHYTRLATVYFPLFEELAKADRTIDNTINGVKLRNKDLEVFTAIFETITRVCSLEDYVYKVGSNDPEYASFASMYGMYLTLIGHMKSVAESLKVFASGDVFEILALKVNIKPKELVDRLSACTDFVKNIPTERSLLLGETQETQETSNTMTQTEPLTSRPKLDRVGIDSFGRQPTPQQQTVEVQPSNPYIAPKMEQPQPSKEMSIDDKAAAMFGSYSHAGGMYPVAPGGQQPYGSLLKSVVSAISTGNASSIHLAPQPTTGYMVVPQPNMAVPNYNNFPPAQAYYPVNQQMVPTMAPMQQQMPQMQMAQPMMYPNMGQQPMPMQQPDNGLGITKSKSNSFSLFK